MHAAILILDSDGNRILGRYYTPPPLPSSPPAPLTGYITTPQPNPYPTLKDQHAFEKGLFEKTKKQSSDVILFDNKLCVYKQAVDTTLYVIGGAEENEIMLYLVVVALRDCLDALLKSPSPFLLGAPWPFLLGARIDSDGTVIRLINGLFSRTTILLHFVSTKFVMMGMLLSGSG
jgi:hypothetical protein